MSIAFTAVAFVSPLLAQVTETQHAAEAAFPLSRKVELTLHTRVRTQPNGLGLYQGRVGPILEIDLAPRLTAIGGYYYTVQSDQEEDIRGTHRFFGGLKGAALETRMVEAELRSLIERFDSSGPGFNRYRHRLRLTTPAKVAPYAGVELFHDAGGWRSTRYSGGIRWATSGRFELDFGYFFENRRNLLGPDRHMVTTSFHFRRRPGKRPDPDF
ncbi:MAG: DUF2490 domain-containing protein [Bryobacteraceae bacterium]|nr:DUF2490 domain-containing protein [Bryobacteraceae bacterium]